MDPRVSELHITNSKSIKEYAYFEDKNFPARKAMEDSISLYMQIISPLMITVNLAAGSLLYLMVMAVLKSLSSVPIPSLMLLSQLYSCSRKNMKRTKLISRESSRELLLRLMIS